MSRRGETGRRFRNGRSPRTSSRSLWRRLFAAAAVVAGHRAEVDVFQLRLDGIEPRARRRRAVDTHDGASGEEPGRDDGVRALDFGQLGLFDDTAPDLS